MVAGNDKSGTGKGIEPLCRRGKLVRSAEIRQIAADEDRVYVAAGDVVHKCRACLGEVHVSAMILPGSKADRTFVQSLFPAHRRWWKVRIREVGQRHGSVAPGGIGGVGRFG